MAPREEVERRFDQATDLATERLRAMWGHISSVAELVSKTRTVVEQSRELIRRFDRTD